MKPTKPNQFRHRISGKLRGWSVDRFGSGLMLFLALPLVLGSGLAMNGCSSSRNTSQNVNIDSTSGTQVLANADPFVVLDEQQKTGNIDPQLIEERLDAARQQWLRAVAAQQ